MTNDKHAKVVGFRSGMTAAEARKLIERRKREDPKYRSALEETEAKRQAVTSELRKAEAPVVVDLRSAGYNIDSVWDLVNSSEPYPEALPVLIRHLQIGGYPERVMESLGRALAVKPAVIFWDTLKDFYTNTQLEGSKDGLGVALSAIATESHVDDLIELVHDERNGKSRIYFLKPISQFGGDKGRKVVEALTSDPVLGIEAAALQKNRKRKIQGSSASHDG